MKFENIIKKLRKEGYKVEEMEFDFVKCLGVMGTAIVNVEGGSVRDSEAKYEEVVKQIKEERSHIYNIEGKRKELSRYKRA